MEMKNIVKKSAAALVAAATLCGGLPAISASAADIGSPVQYDAETQTLYLTGAFTRDDLDPYCAYYWQSSDSDCSGYENPDYPCTSIIAQPGAVMPEDCEYLFYGLGAEVEMKYDEDGYEYGEFEPFALIDLSQADFSNVTKVRRMFDCCHVRALDLSGIDISNLESMTWMFADCYEVETINLTDVDTSNVTDMFLLFSYCVSLKTIFVSDKWSTENLGEGDCGEGLFRYCESLVGGNGTVYDSNHTDFDYARIDTADAPGYFTDGNVTTYDIRVAGNRVTSNNAEDILGDGTVSYDPEALTLTLDGADILLDDPEETCEGISSETAGLTIYVASDSTVIARGTAVAFYEDGTISGPGKLTAKCIDDYLGGPECDGIYISGGTLTFDHANIEAYGASGISAGGNNNDKLVVIASEIAASGDIDAVSCFKAGTVFTECEILQPVGGAVMNYTEPSWGYTYPAICNADGTLALSVSIGVPQERTITYKANGGTGADVVQTHNKGGAATIKANTFTRRGYTFTGWNAKANGSGNTYQPGKEVSWNDNVTLYAQWKQNTSKITYKANGGTGADVVQTHGAGSAATLKPANTFTRKGYTFTGWNSKADGSGNTYAAGKSVSWYDNVTLYAQWKQKTSTITYKANGGTGADVVQSHGAGSAATLKPANTFTRTGYTFTGWNSKADGSGNTYAAGKSVSWYDNVTLYAQWKKSTSTITYKANGGTGSDVVQSHTAGSAATLKPANTFSRTGYTFTGWNTKADGSGNTYAAGKSVSWYDNVTLYAQWKQKTSTITYKANGGTGSDVVQSHGAGSAATLKAATTFNRTGYTFTGWNTKADGSGNTYAAGKSVSWYDNVTLYAQWEKTTSTITYKANGAAGGDIVQSHYAGEKVNLMPANIFSRSGYTFQGWNSKADGSGNTYAAGKEVAWYNNVTLYAIWKKN